MDFLRLDRDTRVCGSKRLADSSTVSPRTVDELRVRGVVEVSQRVDYEGGVDQDSILVPEWAHEPDGMLLEGRLRVGEEPIPSPADLQASFAKDRTISSFHESGAIHLSVKAELQAGLLLESYSDET